VPQNSTAPAAARDSSPAWLSYLFVGLTGALLGAAFTYLSLRPQLRPAASPMQLAAMPDAAGAPLAGGPSGPVDHTPPANLTAGQTSAQAERTLGNWFYDHRDWPEAQRRYESAIRQGSDDADIRTDLGNVYRFQGRAQDALTQYQLAQRQNPQHEFSLFNQGILFADELNDRTAALAIWRQYLERFPAGRNVELARQLLAQATGTMPASATPSAVNPTADPTTQRLFDLVNQAPAPKRP